MPQQFLQNPMNQFERESLPVGWPWRFFMVSFVIFLVSILSYLGLAFGYNPYLNSEIAKKDGEINQLSGAVSKENQDKFIQIYSQMINIKSLLDSHIFSSNVLSLLEQRTHPKVYFTGVNLKSPERELELDGIAASFSVLAEQLEIFAQTKDIEKYTLGQSQLNGDVVQFRITLKLNKSTLILSSL